MNRLLEGPRYQLLGQRRGGHLRRSIFDGDLLLFRHEVNPFNTLNDPEAAAEAYGNAARLRERNAAYREALERVTAAF